MKAKEIVKVSIKIDDIYKRISDLSNDVNNEHVFKISYPHWVFVSNEVKSQFMNDGFKLSIGDWDGIMLDSLIIEW